MLKVSKKIRDKIIENNPYSKKTEIIEGTGSLTIEDMIADEDMVLTISHNGYIKRLPTATWRTQRRGGKGMKGAKTKDDDYVFRLRSGKRTYSMNATFEICLIFLFNLRLFLIRTYF